MYVQYKYGILDLDFQLSSTLIVLYTFIFRVFSTLFSGKLKTPFLQEVTIDLLFTLRRTPSTIAACCPPPIWL